MRAGATSPWTTVPADGELAALRRVSADDMAREGRDRGGGSGAESGAERGSNDASDERQGRERREART